MEHKWAESLFVYKEEYSQRILEEAQKIKDSKENCSYQDLLDVGILHRKEHQGVNTFLSSYNLSDGLNALELGCGLGCTSRYLAGTKNWNLLAIDYLSHYVECAKKLAELCNLSESIEFRQGDITNCELPVNAFDVCIIIGVYLYIPDPGNSFTRIFDSLKPGGLLYWEDYYFKEENLGSQEQWLMSQVPYPGVRTKKALLEEILGVGFELVEWNEFGEEWSESAWNRAEATLEKHRRGEKVDSSALKADCFVITQVLKEFSMPKEEIQEKWPLTYEYVSGNTLFTENQDFMGVCHSVFRKPLEAQQSN